MSLRRHPESFQTHEYFIKAITDAFMEPPPVTVLIIITTIFCCIVAAGCDGSRRGEEEKERWEFIQTFLMWVIKGRQRGIFRWMMSFRNISFPIIEARRLVNTSGASFCGTM